MRLIKKKAAILKPRKLSVIYIAIIIGIILISDFQEPEDIKESQKDYTSKCFIGIHKEHLNKIYQKILRWEKRR